jgi:hypothetical protein
LAIIILAPPICSPLEKRHIGGANIIIVNVPMTEVYTIIHQNVDLKLFLFRVGEGKY